MAQANLHSCYDLCEAADAGTLVGNLADTVCQECTTERQGHGKAFETEVVKMIGTDIENAGGQAMATTLAQHNANSGHTDNHDFEFSRVGHARAAADGLAAKYHLSDGISIKMIKEGCQVCMGDAVRISQNFATPWSILVAFYIDIEMPDGRKCKCIKRAYLLNLTPADRVHFFGNVTDAQIVGLRDMMRAFNVGVHGSLQDLRQLVVPVKNDLQREIRDGGGKLSLAQKISATNKRLQCQIGSAAFVQLMAALPAAQVIEIDKADYPDLFKPIVPPGSIGGKRKSTRKRRKSKKHHKKHRKTRRMKKSKKHSRSSKRHRRKTNRRRR